MAHRMELSKTELLEIIVDLEEKNTELSGQIKLFIDEIELESDNDKFLTECASNCHCCQECNQFKPCAGTQQGAGCDKMCSCDDDWGRDAVKYEGEYLG